MKIKNISIQPFIESPNYLCVLPLFTLDYQKPQFYSPYKILIIELGWLWFFVDIEIEFE